MNVNTDAVLVFAGIVFVLTMGGLGGVWMWARHEDRLFWREMERRRADRN